MTYIASTPNLMVKDVNLTVDFYTNILGFKVIETFPKEGKLDFAIVQADNIMFMFQEENSLKSELPQLKKFTEGGGLTFYIIVSDVQALFEKVDGKVTIAKDMHQTFYESTDFAIEDCNGYILVFSQHDNYK